MTGQLKTLIFPALIMVSATGLAAQEAPVKGVELRLVSGSDDGLGWISPIVNRKGDRIRFWQFHMPSKITRVRHDENGKTRFISYDVLAQLFEGDCGDRTQIRRIRTEFYLGGELRRDAEAPLKHAGEYPLAPDAPAARGLETLCANIPSATSAPDIKTARSLTDGWFRRKAGAQSGTVQ